MSLQKNSSNIVETYIVEELEGISGKCVYITAEIIEPCTGDTVHISENLYVDNAISATTFHGDGTYITGLQDLLAPTFVNVTGDTMLGDLTLPNLSAITISATTFHGDGTYITGLQDLLEPTFVNVSGDTMSGDLILPNLSATTITGDTIYGNGYNLTNIDHNLTVINQQGGVSNEYYHLTQDEYSKVSGDTLNTTFVNLTGDTMLGDLTVPNLSATTISATTFHGNGTYITGLQDLLDPTFVNVSGDTMVGDLTLPNLSAITISATTLYGDGSNITSLDHNTVITNKQGGLTGQYYHLNQDEYSKVSGDTLENTFVNITGDSMSGNLYVPVITANTLNVTSTITNPINEEIIVDSSLIIKKNVIILGNTITANTEQVLIKDNLLTLNYGETGSTVTKGTAGIEIDRGTGTKYQFIFNESTDTFDVGMPSTLQPVATRELNPISNGIAIWDDGNSRFVTTLNLTATTFTGNGSNLTNIDHNSATITNKQGGTSGQYYHLTQDEYSKVSGNTLETTFVNVTGDSMSGNLTVPNITITSLTGTTTRGVKVDSNGLLVASTDKVIHENLITTTVLQEFNKTDADGAVWHYSITSTNNARTGTISGTWLQANDSNDYYETSTNDIGNTTPVSLSVTVSGGKVRLLATISSGTWNIKTILNLL